MKQLFLFLLSICALILPAQNRYLGPVFDQVTVTQNIQYGRNATILAVSVLGEAIPQPLSLDLYEPAGDTAATRPLVLVMHGGFFFPSTMNGWCSGTKSDSMVVEICTRLAKMGYLAAAVDYRLGWNPLAFEQTVRLYTFTNALYRGIQDARTAIRYFKKTAVENGNLFRVDTARIVLWGESTGGQVALGAAYTNSPNDWTVSSLMIPPNLPVVSPSVNGDIWGTSTGIVPPGSSAGLPVGDTLCYPNWPGYSSDFQLCVSMAAQVLDQSWVNAGEMPAVLFHALNDELQPCGSSLLEVLLPVNLAIIEAFGSCVVAEQLDAAGNNQVFWDANINDCVTNNALTNSGGLEGFYPFVGLPSDRGRAWQWSAPCPNNASVPTNGAFARQYIDTIFAYFAPRACAALALCNAQPYPNSLCGTQAKGKAFLDINQNASLDAGESSFPEVVIELQPGGYHAASGVNGNFSITVPPGNYTLNVPNAPNYYAPTNVPLSVTVPVGADVVQNIGLHPTVTANDLQVSLTPFAQPNPGFSNTFLVKWKNVGTTQLSGNVSLTVDPNYLIVSSIPSANISGNVATWMINNLLPLQTGSAWLQVSLPATVPLGTLLTSTAVVSPTGLTDETPDDNIASTAQIVIGSFDPNDKQVSPAGDVTAGILEEHDGWLDYTVRFQNTGTAPAVNVYIVDTLSDLLNINTLEIISNSHPMRWEIGGQRTLTFFFDNIQLPDSLQNEANSHGFVRYRIQPLSPFKVLLNKTARNFADIYFDFNAPIRTNTVETKFTEFVGVNTPSAAQPMRIFPNPVGDIARLEWPLSGISETVTLRVFNATGATVLLREILISGNVFQEKLSVKDWAKGVYFVQLRTRSGIVSGRFVKE